MDQFLQAPWLVVGDDWYEEQIVRLEMLDRGAVEFRAMRYPLGCAGAHMRFDEAMAKAERFARDGQDFLRTAMNASSVGLLDWGGLGRETSAVYDHLRDAPLEVANLCE